MKPHFLTILLCALLGLVLWLMPTQWLPWLGAVRGAGEGHFGTATTVITVLLLLGIGAASVAATACIKIGTRLIPQPDFRSVLQVMGVVFLVVLLTGASFVAPIAGAFSNAVYVSAGGNLTAAKNAAVAGGTIFVGPGTYYNCSNLLKSGVNWIGNNSWLTFTNRSNDLGWGIFDDRFSGATTSSITGFNYIYAPSLPYTNASFSPCCVNNAALAAIVVSNRLTSLTVKGGKLIYYAANPHNQGVGGVWMSEGSNYLAFDAILDGFYGTNYSLGIDDLDTEITVSSIGTGVYWEDGFLSSKVSVLSGELYSIYAHGITNGDMYHVSDLIHGTVYMNTESNKPNYKLWVTAGEIRNSASASKSAITMLGGGKLYVTAQKLSSSGTIRYTINIGGVDGYAWINAMKITGAGGWVRSSGFTTTDITCQQYEDAGGTTTGFHADENAKLNVYGGRAMMTNALIASTQSNAWMRLTGVDFNNTNATGTNAAIAVKNDRLILAGGSILGPTWSLLATQSVGVNVYGTVFNKPTTNVTIRVGPSTVDPLVR